MRWRGQRGGVEKQRGRIGGVVGWWRWGGRGVAAFWVLLGDVVSNFVEVVGVLELTSGCSGGWAC